MYRAYSDQPNSLFVTDTEVWEAADDIKFCYHEKILSDRGEVPV